MDYTIRVARGRWRADDEDKVEGFAEERQHEWVRDAVIPYVHERYPEQVEMLLGWIQQRGGIRVSLETLLGDPRQRLDGKTLQEWFPFRDAFEGLVTNVARGMDPIEARLTLAHELQVGDHHDEILGIVRSVLAERPGHHGALLERGEVFLVQRRLDEAERIARAVIAEDDDNGVAWSMLSSIHRRRLDWGELVKSATRAFELLSAEDPDRAGFELEKRARAWLGIGDVVSLQADLQAIEQVRPRSLQAPALRAVMLLEKGRLEEALAQAKRLLVRSYQRKLNPELVAIQFEAARRLGRKGEEGRLTSETLERMRDDGYLEWADRLAPFVAS